jgi:hypothetical protein
MAFLALLITFVGGLSPTSLVFLPALILIAIASGRHSIRQARIIDATRRGLLGDCDRGAVS